MTAEPTWGPIWRWFAGSWVAMAEGDRVLVASPDRADVVVWLDDHPNFECVVWKVPTDLTEAARVVIEWPAGTVSMLDTPSLIDPDKWLDQHAANANQAGWSFGMDAMAAWCLTAMAPTWLGALVAALPSTPAPTLADFPLWSTWMDDRGIVRTVRGRHDPALATTVVVSGRGAGRVERHALDAMSSWRCLSTPTPVSP